MTSTKEKLDKVSASFCLAKWYRTNLRLDTGLTYSCHHCQQHPIDVEKIKEDPGKLTNTDYIIDRRKEMISGLRPDECNYCWSAEDQGNLSDRIAKSYGIDVREAQKGKRDLFKEASENYAVVPSLFEISFDNTCNLKCAYCSPTCSSKWEEEYKQYGPYPTELKRTVESKKILNREHNPYMEAFWNWWPDLKENVETLKITGGEPLLSKHTYKLLDLIIKDDVPFNFSINSNMSVDIEPLLERIEKPLKCFDNFTLNTSLESNKEQGEYSRFGLDFDLFDSNVRKYLKRTEKNLNFMSTVNILSITSYYDFISYVNELKEEYGKQRIMFVPTYMRYPEYLNIRLLPKGIKEEICDKLNSVNDISNLEKKRLTSLTDYMNGELSNEKSLRSDFVKFIREYDRRRNTDFEKVYPNLAHLLEDWK